MFSKRNISYLVSGLVLASLIIGMYFERKSRHEQKCCILVVGSITDSNASNRQSHSAPKALLDLLNSEDPCSKKALAFEGKMSSLKAPINNDQIRIVYSKLQTSRISKKWAKELNSYCHAIIVPSSTSIKAYKKSGVKIPIFTVDNLQKLYKSLINPKRIILGSKNEVNEAYLMTKSEDLYAKYKKLAAPAPTFFYQPDRPTSLINFLKPIEVSSTAPGLHGIDCIYVINLDERPERWAYVKKCFDEQGLIVNRVSAINGWKIPLEERIQLTDPSADLISAGAFGCLLSHVSIYKDALDRNFDTIWICEDDIEFKKKANVITSLIQRLTAIDPEWDVLYTDYSTKGVGHQNPRNGQPHYEEFNAPISDEFIRMHGRYNMHSMVFSKRGLDKALEYFLHVYVHTPIDVDIHYVPKFKEYSVTKDIVTSKNDSSLESLDGSSDTQLISPLNHSSN